MLHTEVVIQDYFKKEAMIHIGSLILDRLSLADVSHFEIALVKNGIQFFEAYYQKLVQRYFLCIEYSKEIPYRRQFKEGVLGILNALKRQYGLKFSVSIFYAAATGNFQSLLLQHSRSLSIEQEWLWAIQYSYHAIAPKSDFSALKRVAFLYAYRKDYVALEHLVQENSIVLTGGIKNSSLGPIIFYAGCGCLEKVKALLVGAAKVSIRDKRKAFVEAAIYGQVEVMQKLLHCGEVIFSEDKGWAFEKAAYYGHIKVVEELLQQEGKAISVLYKRKALFGAVKKGGLEIVQKLLKHYAAELCVKDQGRVLIDAAHYGHVAVVKILIDYYAKTFMIQDRMQALTQAIQWREEKLLWGEAGSVNISLEESAKELFGWKEHLKVVQELLFKREGQKDLPVEDRFVAFQEAAFHCDVAIVKELLQKREGQKEISIKDIYKVFQEVWGHVRQTTGISVFDKDIGRQEAFKLRRIETLNFLLEHLRERMCGKKISLQEANKIFLWARVWVVSELGNVLDEKLSLRMKGWAAWIAIQNREFTVAGRLTRSFIKHFFSWPIVSLSTSPALSTSDPGNIQKEMLPVHSFLVSQNVTHAPLLSQEASALLANIEETRDTVHP